MGLSVVTAAASLPVSVAEAKSHMRVDISDDDTVIENYIKSATDYAEGRTRRAFVSQTWDYTLPEFPVSSLDAIELPIMPVSSVTYVQYVDTSGNTASFADTSVSPESPYWTLTTDGPRPKVVPNYNLNWPTTRDHGILGPLGDGELAVLHTHAFERYVRTLWRSARRLRTISELLCPGTDPGSYHSPPSWKVVRIWQYVRNNGSVFQHAFCFHYLARGGK